MIKEFNNAQGKECGMIDKFILDQAKSIYDVYPELAGELAISALEYSLTGQISSDNYCIKAVIQQYKQHLEENQ